MTTHVEPLMPAGDGADARLSRLEARVRTLRSRSGSAQLDRWMLVVGGALMPLGLLAILLGWAGASRTPLLFEQIPYLISGGLLGLGLTFTGGFLYFTYWQTVRVRESHAQQRELLTALGRLEAILAAGATTEAGSTDRRTMRLVATENGSLFHTIDCPIVQGRDNLRPVTAGEGGLRPCKLCTPDS